MDDVFVLCCFGCCCSHDLSSVRHSRPYFPLAAEYFYKFYVPLFLIDQFFPPLFSLYFSSLSLSFLYISFTSYFPSLPNVFLLISYSFFFPTHYLLPLFIIIFSLTIQFHSLHLPYLLFSLTPQCLSSNLFTLPSSTSYQHSFSDLPFSFHISFSLYFSLTPQISFFSTPFSFPHFQKPFLSNFI